ncbi:uncharacterized protein [Cicer arietinum]|uniref:Uncharacterized protein LOC101508704 isoform X2 n=1 Tax=Cicer arietinum TaxID=3827 RepID=A0A1S2XE89_CICAR|nr:uncharacterized protein LOC101508704 isoform X2 [Cicer arietinum]
MAENPPETVPFNSQPPSSSSSSQKSPQDPSPSQVPVFSNLPAFPGGYYQVFPGMYPALIPGLTPQQNEEHANRGAGLYAVPVNSFDRHVTGLPYNTLIPLTYRTPTRPSSEAAAGSENQGQAAQQQPAPQRQVVVRRFQIAFQIDLLLMLKLAAVIFLFNQDGSRQRLVVLVLFAVIVYLYQTGALTPIIRWLSQGMQRAAAPPRPPRPAARAENVPAARQEVDNAAPAEGQPEAAVGNPPANDADRAIENENVVEANRGNGGNQWWGIVKEIQMIVFGFITSLLPGFHNHMD